MEKGKEHLSNTQRIWITIACIGAFVTVAIVFFIIFENASVERTASTVMSVISGLIVVWIILSLSGILREFSIKSPFFEMTANLAEKINDVKKETERIQSNIQNINQRLDSVITNQLTAKQTQTVSVNINEKQQEKKIIENSIDAQLPSDLAGEIRPDKKIEIPEEKRLEIDNQLKRLDNVEKILSDLKADTIDIGATIKRANYYYTTKQYEKAIELYDRVLRVQPDNLSALFNKAYSSSRLRKDREAIENYKKYLSIEEYNEIVYGNISYNYIQLKDFQNAKEYAIKSTKINPQYSLGWYNLACVNALLQEKDEAISNLKKATDLDEYYKQKAEKDPDFEIIKNDPRFKKLISE